MCTCVVGLVPDAGTTWLVARAVGRAKALELAMLGEKITADDALAMGLVNKVAEDDALLAEAQALAARLAGLTVPASGAWLTAARVAAGVSTNPVHHRIRSTTASCEIIYPVR